MSRPKNSRPSYHPRTRKIPHPDVLREYASYRDSKTGENVQVSDDQLTGDYLNDRTVAGAENLNPYPPGKRSDAYLSYLNNEQFLIQSDPTYRPETSAHDMRGKAQAEVDSFHTED